MIVSAALCPSPPLLARALTGQALVLPEFRAACAAAVSRLVGCAPDLVIVVGPADVTAVLDAAGRLDLSRYAPALGAVSNSAVSNSAVSNSAVSNSAVSNSAVSDSAGRAPLPLAVGIGAMLLDEAGHAGPRLLQGVARTLAPDACLALGRDLAAAAPRVALLAMGEGSARRALSAPGYLDERAEPFDAAVERAVRDGDLAALAAIDPVLADDLMVTGRPAWQVLAGALRDGRAAASSPAPFRPETEIGYCAAPLGVAYLVASLAVARNEANAAAHGSQEAVARKR